MRNQTIPQIVVPGEQLSLRFDLYENQGLNNVEHVYLSIDSDSNSTKPAASVEFNRHKDPQLVIKDTNEIFTDAQFTILEEDPTNFVLKFDFVFTKQIPPADIKLMVWDLDRNLAKETFAEAIAVGEFNEDQFKVPEWIKSNAEWWSEGQITDEEFVSGIKFLIENGVIVIPETVSAESSDSIPEWIRSNAEWWSDDLISDSEFVSGIQFLISKGIIQMIT